MGSEMCIRDRAWEAAIAPVKSIPMNLMMLYMSGNSVQIFSMMVVYMTVVNPLKGITTLNAGTSRVLIRSVCAVPQPEAHGAPTDARVHRVPAGLHLGRPVQVLEHGPAPDRGQRLARMVQGAQRTSPDALTQPLEYTPRLA